MTRRARRRDILLGAGGLALGGACGSAPRTEELARRGRPPPEAITLPTTQWVRLGPGGGGATFLPTVSPLDPERAVVACDMTASYVTKDGGVWWRLVNLRARARFFVWDPTARDTLYAATIGLFRSRDAGVTWQLVVPSPARLRGVVARGDHADEELVVDGDLDRVTALAVDPSDGDVLFLGITRGDEHGLFLSTDGGATYASSRVTEKPISHIAIDPRSTPELRRSILVTQDRIIDLNPGAVVEHPLAAPLDEVKFIFSAAGPVVVYARSGGQMLVSRDGGARFEPLTVGSSALEIRAVAASSALAQVAYASFSGDVAGRPSFGVARTDDFGASFHFVWREERAASPAVDDGWVSERFGPSWGENPLGIGLSDKSSARLFATDMGRVLRSRDAGRTFRAVYTRKYLSAFVSTGLDVTNVHDVVFDPRTPRRVFVAMSDVGLFRSEDGGLSWTSATSLGVPAAWTNSTYAAAFDPDDPARMLIATSDTHDLPRPKMWRKNAVASFAGGLCVSENAGVSFRPVPGLPSAAFTHVVMRPGGLVVAAAFGKGVWISRDGGRSFVDASAGLPDEPLVYRVGVDARDGVWAVLVRRTEDAEVGSRSAGAVFRAPSAGARFAPIALPEGVAGPNGIALDPSDFRAVVLAAWPRDGGPDGGLFVTRDAGATWTRSAAPEPYAFDAVFDPRVPGRVYAAGFTSRALISNDGGASFAPLVGFDFKWAQRVVLDPRDPKRIWVATFGGGLWTGPAAGAPPTTEVDLPAVLPR